MSYESHEMRRTSAEYTWRIWRQCRRLSRHFVEVSLCLQVVPLGANDLWAFGRLRTLLALVLDYGLDGAWRIICYNIHPIHRMRLNTANAWSLPRCSASCAKCTHAHEFPRECGYNRQTRPSL